MLASIVVVFLFSIMGKTSKISNGSKIMSSLAERSPDIVAGVDIRCYFRRKSLLPGVTAVSTHQ